MNAPRVLLSAYQCGSGLGSVSQIGWEWYSRLAAKLPVTLFTHIRNQAALEKAGAPLPGSEVVYIDTEWFAGPLYRTAAKLFPKSEHPVFLISSLDFYLYDWTALRTAKRLRKAGQAWDIVHQATPVSPLAATWLYRLGLPLVLGPWNGGLASPTQYPEIMRTESGWMYAIRRLGYLIDALIGSTRNASLILSATSATRLAIAERYQDKCVDMLENGVNLDLFSPQTWPEPPSADNPLRIIFVGRLLAVKGVAMLLESLLPLDFPYHLTIVGSGPEEALLRLQVQNLNLTDKVHFTGGLPLALVAEEMAKAHVFCLPSVRESGGSVLLEAMAAARPVVALAYGGPAEIVDEEVGCLIPSTGWKPVVSALTQIWREVVAQPDEWRCKGLIGRQRVEQHYSWAAKIDSAIQLYQTCLEAK